MGEATVCPPLATSKQESPAVAREDACSLYSSCCSNDLQGHHCQ